MKNLNYLSSILLCTLLLFGCAEETKNISPTKPILNVPDEFKHLPVIDVNKYTVNSLPEKYSKASMISPSYISTGKRDIQQTYGPYGSADNFIIKATPFNWPLPDKFDRINAIAFSPGQGQVISYFQVWFGDAGDKITTYGPAGTSGNNFNMIYFAKDEKIIYIAGGTGTFLVQLTIVTNKRIITSGGDLTSFSSCFYCSNQEGLGFFGGVWATSFVQRIGFYGY